jgi:mannose-6-phosphate isomerase-like protein (cupin superfamily)
MLNTLSLSPNSYPTESFFTGGIEKMGLDEDNSRIGPIDIEVKCKEIEEPWSPIDLLRVNDQVVRMALFHGRYHWHRHANEDELFYVYRGRVVIRMRDHEDVELSDGMMTVVPRDVAHRPESPEPSYVLMFEPYELKSRGD